MFSHGKILLIKLYRRVYELIVNEFAFLEDIIDMSVQKYK
jgi:hypothetical protein